jgi:DNA-binding response OmpR family regulator
MKHILLIEDELFIAGVYRDALRAVGFKVELATDGRSGLQKFHRRRPDLVLLDLMLPQADGIEVLRAIRASTNPKEVPVLVFTNAFLGGMVQAAWEAGATQVITKAAHPPSQVARIVRAVLDDSCPAGSRKSAIVGDRSPKMDPVVREQFLATAPETLAGLLDAYEMLANDPKDPACLAKLYAKVRLLNAAVTVAGLWPAARMAEALEGLLRVLSEKKYDVSDSILLTLTQAIDTLEYLASNPDAVAHRDPSQARILVVDDDEFVRYAVHSALEKVNLKSICLDNPASVLQEEAGDRFDLIFLDIEMPITDGFSLCSILRSAPAYQGTPIIFLSMHADEKHRQESFAHGGNDFISKPFLFMELAVKALSFVMRGSWDNRETVTQSPTPHLDCSNERRLVSQPVALPSNDLIFDASTAATSSPSSALQTETA